MKPRVWVTGTAILALVTAARAQITFTETFDNGSNVGGWTYGSPNGYIDQSGGNPGPFWHDPYLDTFAPQPRTTQQSIYTGDYRGQRIVSVEIDLILFYVDFSAGGRPLSVILNEDNDTPGNWSDDWGAFYIGPENVPLVGEGWRSYEFDIPAQETSLPTGWKYIQYGPNAPPPDWNTVIQDVDQLVFFYGDPEMFFTFQVWDVGLDNPRISYLPEPVLGDLNCDGLVDFGDINPFVLALTNPAGYAQAFPYCDIMNADINADGRVDFGDINPFVRLLTRD